MPTERDHLNQVQHNEEVADRLLHSQEPSTQWAVTVLFYAALHLVESYFARHGIVYPEPRKSPSHGGRIELIRQRPELQPIVDSYRQLLQDSQNARYDCRQFTLGEVEQMQQTLYTPIVNHVRSLLSSTTT